MAPLPDFYTAINEETGEEIYGLASELSERLGITYSVISTYAKNNRKFQKKWLFIKEQKIFRNEEEKQDWENTCKPFREVSKRKRGLECGGNNSAAEI